MKKIFTGLCIITMLVFLTGCTEMFGAPSDPNGGTTISLSEATDLADRMGASANDINIVLDAASELNVRIFGINDVTTQQFLTEYTIDHADWDSRLNQDDGGTGWNSYIRVWSKLTYVHAFIIWDGAIVKSLTGYDVVVVTSHGLYTTYQEYFSW